MFRRIIAITGPDEGGKDTTAGLVEEACRERGLSTFRLAFADPVKDAISEVMDIPRDQVDTFKLNGRVSMGWQPYRASNRWSMSGREFIRQFAEAHKRLHGEDYWVRLALPDDLRMINCDVCVISDLRFAVEAKRVRELGGEIWQLFGRGKPGNGDIPAGEADERIDNSEPLEDLCFTVKSLLNRKELCSPPSH